MDADWQPVAGSAAYYSIRFSAQAIRSDVQLVFAWQQLLQELLANATDPGVSRLKLDWWTQELERSMQGDAKHPLTKQFPSTLTSSTAIELFQTMLIAADRDLQRQSTPVINDWHVHCGHWGESLAKLLILASRGTEKEYTTIRGLGRYVEVVQRINELAVTRQEFHLPLPDKQIQILIKPVRDKAIDILDSKTTLATTAVHCLAAQVLTLDKKMIKQDFHLNDQPIEILPISRLWTAWRTSRNIEKTGHIGNNL